MAICHAGLLLSVMMVTYKSMMCSYKFEFSFTFIFSSNVSKSLDESRVICTSLADLHSVAEDEMTETDATVVAVGAVDIHSSTRSAVFDVRRTTNRRRQAAQQLPVVSTNHDAPSVRLRPRRRGRHVGDVIALAAALRM